MFRRSLSFALAVFATATPPLAYADDFFELSPGKLSKAHQRWNDDCEACHEVGGGVTEARCLGCHDHKNLRQQLRAGQGLHASFKNKPCTQCHGEHKGPLAAITSWRALGGMRRFDHDQTSFSLAGQHKKVACTKCHQKKFRTGRTSFLGLKSGCDDCHKNPHRFTNRKLRKNCEGCHPSTGGRKRRLKKRDLPFDHGEVTGLHLLGAHQKLRCYQCHKRGNMSMKRTRRCKDCHKSPHGRSFRRARCEDCHQESLPFRKSSFDHGETGFHLKGRHKKQNCSTCHNQRRSSAFQASERKFPIPRGACADCHKDPHRGRFEKRSCASCHGDEASKRRILFDHTKEGKFALTGKHARLRCRACHTGRRPYRFKKLAPHKDCMACHTHRNVHKRQFPNEKCLECHLKPGVQKVDFDHQRDTQFPLTGLHLALEKKKQCEKCHPKGKYKTGRTECKDCHKDSHKGSLGGSCDRCHDTSTEFKKTDEHFDHAQETRFTLEAKHRTLDCAQCHPSRKYKTDSMACVSCHRDDDPHDRKLGDDCAKCHIPDDGAPKFDHNSMTRFALTGFHKKVACGYCHDGARSAPRPRGWTKGHPAPEKVLSFPVTGTDCRNCHQDVHEGRYGTSCESCHSTDSFDTAQRAVHDTGAFRLEGLHDQIRCDRCHFPKRLLTGLGDLCVECHRDDDIHNQSLGPFCGDCHRQQAWRPARFNHGMVGFFLRGAHRTAECRDCHGIGVYAGTPTDCGFCHGHEAARVLSPVHNQALRDCTDCHNEVQFAPARRYHPWHILRGAHIAADCAGCHPGGRYTGTPVECEECHLDDYQNPDNRPNHVLANIGTDCTRCHREGFWAGARYQHQAFIRRGQHRVAACASCHPGEDYNGAFGGTVSDFVCESCHGAGAPRDRWPPDHATRGFPNTCALCHNELGWLPARSPN